MSDKPTPREQEKYAESPAYQPEERPWQYRTKNPNTGELSPWFPCSSKGAERASACGYEVRCLVATLNPMPVERIAMLWNSLPLETDPDAVVSFVRAIEAFHDADRDKQRWYDYGEGRKDEAEQNAWQPIDAAPEDEHILIATTGGHIGTAYWTNDGDGVEWAWGHPERDYGQCLHPKLKAIAWMPLPKHPEQGL